MFAARGVNAANAPLGRGIERYMMFETTVSNEPTNAPTLGDGRFRCGRGRDRGQDPKHNFPCRRVLRRNILDVGKLYYSKYFVVKNINPLAIFVYLFYMEISGKSLPQL